MTVSLAKWSLSSGQKEQLSHAFKGDLFDRQGSRSCGVAQATLHIGTRLQLYQSSLFFKLYLLNEVLFTF